MKEYMSPEDKVFEDYKKGLPNGFTVKGKKIRGSKPVDTKKATVQISMKIEYELLNLIRQAADKEGLPYQTFMKQILRDFLKDSSLKSRVQKIEERLTQLEVR